MRIDNMLKFYYLKKKHLLIVEWGNKKTFFEGKIVIHVLVND